MTLTYHKGGARLVCHYCGYTAPVPAKCPSCEVTEVLPRGFGTEKVEEAVSYTHLDVYKRQGEEAAADEPLDFKTIKLQYNVQAKFVLE